MPASSHASSMPMRALTSLCLMYNLSSFTKPIALTRCFCKVFNKARVFFWISVIDSPSLTKGKSSKVMESGAPAQASVRAQGLALHWQSGRQSMQYTMKMCNAHDKDVSRTVELAYRLTLPCFSLFNHRDWLRPDSSPPFALQYQSALATESRIARRRRRAIQVRGRDGPAPEASRWHPGQRAPDAPA